VIVVNLLNDIITELSQESQFYRVVSSFSVTTNPILKSYDLFGQNVRMILTLFTSSTQLLDCPSLRPASTKLVFLRAFRVPPDRVVDW